MEVISIVGGGWSVSEIDQTKIPGHIIGVNDACLRLPRVNAGISMDRLWAENRWAKLEHKRFSLALRSAAARNVPHDRPWLHIFECDYQSAEFADEGEGRLNGRNSGYCALNLAYLYRPKQLWLFGFDMRKGPNAEPYWYPPYEWAVAKGGTSSGRYEEWAGDFAIAARYFKAAGTEVFNVNSRTAITAFPIITPQQFKEIHP